MAHSRPGLLLAADGGVAGLVWPVLEPRERQAEPRTAAKSVVDDVDWDKLIARHDRRVVVALIAGGVGIEEAKELAQETWIRLVEQRRKGLLAQLELPHLAIRQACFLAGDRLRKRRRRLALVRRYGAASDFDPAAMPESDSGPTQQAPDLERRLDARSELRLALSVVAKSSSTVRAVFEGLYGPPSASASEIAADLGLSVQRVRQIACELRVRIRKVWEGGAGA